VVHNLWLVKADIQRPVIYGTILAALLGIRLWFRFRERIVETVVTTSRVA
jgi:sulfoxide reductase heme-binding subunit YedZ